MPKVKITPKIVRTATCPPGHSKVDLFDTDLIGFMLEVRSSGGKTFYQRYRDQRGRDRQFKIGDASALTLDQAKRKAQLVRAEALLGPDPQLKRQETRSVPTVAEFARDRYLPHVREYKRSWKTDEGMLRLHVLPLIGDKHLDELTTDDIAIILRTMKGKGYKPATLNRTAVMVTYMLNLAIKWKVVPSGFENPATGIQMEHEEHRERYLNAEETQRLLDAIRAEKNVAGANAILLLLLTGARRSEVLHAQWQHVDWERRTLLVPRSKSGKPRRIALNAQAVEVLRSIERTPGSPYIFPSPATGRPAPHLNWCWARIRERAGLHDLRLHDLRHSFASFLVNKGVSLYVVQGLLGHTQIRTTQRYAHLSQETLIDAAAIAGDFVQPRTPSLDD